MNNIEINCVCDKCFHFPIIMVLQFQRGKIQIKCQCGKQQIISIKKYISLQSSFTNSSKPIITTDIITKQTFNIDEIKGRIKDVTIYLDNDLNNIKKEHLDYSGNQNIPIESAYRQCVEENKEILHFIELLLDNYSKYNNDIYLEKSIRYNTNFIAYCYESEINKDNNNYGNLESIKKVKKFIYFLEHYSVVSYSFNKITTIEDQGYIKDIAILPDRRLVISSIENDTFGYDEDIDDEKRISIYNNNICEITQKMKIKCLLVNSNGQLVLISSSSKTISLYNIDKSSLTLCYTKNYSDKIEKNYSCKEAILLGNDRIALNFEKFILIWSTSPPYDFISIINYKKNTYNELIQTLFYHQGQNLLIGLTYEMEDNIFMEDSDPDEFMPGKELIKIWELKTFKLIQTFIYCDFYEQYDKFDNRFFELDNDKILFIDLFSIKVINLKSKNIETLIELQKIKYRNLTGIKEKDGNIILMNMRGKIVYDPNKGIIVHKNYHSSISFNKFTILNDEFIANIFNKEVTIYKY